MEDMSEGSYQCPKPGGGLLSPGRPERLLGGVDHVQEAVLVPLALVHLGNGRRHGDHAVAVYQQEESLV